MSFTGTLKDNLEKIDEFLDILIGNTNCITIERDGVNCTFARESYCLSCLAIDAYDEEDEKKLFLFTKVLEHINRGDECLYEEKEYL